ncbi:NUDIX hydrolase [Candidatus Woesearchaeota archaeon]|nr:NUDIX hydrolase [Candidatus Woesearchaeota archaeon]
MPQPLLVTVAIITQDVSETPENALSTSKNMSEEKYLLIRRGREPFKGMWAFIGGCGAFERTLDPSEAVTQEVQADIQCKFDPTFLCYRSETVHVPSIVFYFYGSIKGIPHPNPKYVSEWKWVTLKELLNMQLAFNQQEVINSFFTKKPL